MELSLFLAKVIGLYLVIVNLSMLFNLNRFTSTFKEIIDTDSTHLVLGFHLLLIGLLLVVSHNVWVCAWPVLITLISWMLLIKGVLYLSCPDHLKSYCKSYLKSKQCCRVGITINLVLGFVLCYFGFFKIIKHYIF